MLRWRPLGFESPSASATQTEIHGKEGGFLVSKLAQDPNVPIVRPVVIVQG